MTARRPPLLATPEEHRAAAMLRQMAPTLADPVFDLSSIGVDGQATGRSRRSVFLGAFLGELREGGVRVCTCQNRAEPHLLDPACTPLFVVDPRGDVTLA